MEYGTYVVSMFIIGAVILGMIIVKLLSMLCNVLRSRFRLDFCFGADVISGSEASQYNNESFTQRSALRHYEETPQPIVDMVPGSSESSLPAFMTPPPYSIAVDEVYEKPPTYDEAVGGGSPTFVITEER